MAGMETNDIFPLSIAPRQIKIKLRKIKLIIILFFCNILFLLIQHCRIGNTGFHNSCISKTKEH
jgi:hypothetical protein